MMYFWPNFYGFIFFIAIFLLSVRMFRSSKRIFMKAILCIIIFASSSCSIKSMISMFGDNFETETRNLVQSMFFWDNKTDPDFIMSMKDARKTSGFKLANTYVHSVWHGKYRIYNGEIPFNIYEINLEWKNEKKDTVEYNCFMMAYATDTINDFLKAMSYSDDCSKKDEWILKIKESITQ
ncbi:hypothetical protein [Xenorhabdus bovienii]|uniref:Uncharacterized protein n=2 Tax=Xenorhabdus bovienii TaxID=40576 RepID=A0A077QPJ0_XENBV|nr:hypothetical protein [Xenorhabdus bovienii]CDH34241.1 hypothetical protein XBI1_3010010 [Xenorhabdus bovienii str. Intermedium]